jgi:hypothetical protein
MAMAVRIGKRKKETKKLQFQLSFGVSKELWLLYRTGLREAVFKGLKAK